MIIGIGSDIIEIDRVQKALNRFEGRFLNRIFTPFERERGAMAQNPGAHYAKRFAAKEALAKALGTGFSQGVSWHDIEIRNSPQGQPYLQCRGKARARLDQMSPKGHETHLHLTLSDSKNHALAVVVLDAQKTSKEG